MISINPRILFIVLLALGVSCMRRTGGNSVLPPASGPTLADVLYEGLDMRQVQLFEKYPGVLAPAATFWKNSLDVSQRVEYAGGTRVVIKYETDHKWQAFQSIMKINGKMPNASSAEQFNVQVVWSKDAPAHFRELPGWGEHIALLHPGQYGYQENRDDNPFLGLVVLFDQDPKDPNQLTGQFHIDFRAWFDHYQPENGEIGDRDNYQLYKRWYGAVPNYEP